MREQLSKEVCILCHRRQEEDIYHPRGRDWDFRDEEQWEELHTVICDEEVFMRSEPKFKAASTYRPPPDWCPYRFQHAIALGREL